MQLDAEDLLAQFRKDWPAEYEMSSLRSLVERQDAELARKDAEIERLTALLPATTTTYSASNVRPYVGNGQTADDDGARHGG